jgi:hypothetical protein
MNFKLTAEQYEQIEGKIGLTGTEDYAVVVQKRHGKARYATHVFSRPATTTELVSYEDTASKVEYRGNKAQVKGSALLAAETLYNKLIARAYDVQNGRELFNELDATQAKAKVHPLQKREAIREFLGNVSGLTSLTEDDADESEA